MWRLMVAEQLTSGLVCFIEFSSIMSNILKPKGYDVNFAKLVAVIFGKKFDIANKDIEEIIEKK